MCQFSCVFCYEFVSFLGTSKKAKFGGVMNAQNTHHIPAVYHVFRSFHTLISDSRDRVILVFLFSFSNFY